MITITSGESYLIPLFVFVADVSEYTHRNWHSQIRQRTEQSAQRHLIR